jgi:hypothetical protein
MMSPRSVHQYVDLMYVSSNHLRLWSFSRTEHLNINSILDGLPFAIEPQMKSKMGFLTVSATSEKVNCSAESPGHP